MAKGKTTQEMFAHGNEKVNQSRVSMCLVPTPLDQVLLERVAGGGIARRNANLTVN